MAQDLVIYETGIRDGELLVASKHNVQAAGTSFYVYFDHDDEIYPPSKLGVEVLLTYGHTLIRDKFNQLAFFRDMPVERRIKWLVKNASTNNDLYLSDLTNIRLKFVSLGGKFMEKALTSEQISYLLNAESVRMTEVYDMFPKSKGKGFGKRHTLVFRPGNWSLASIKDLEAPDYLDEYRGLILTWMGVLTILPTKTRDSFYMLNESNKLVVQGPPKEMINTDTRRISAFKTEFDTLLSNESYAKIVPYLKWLSPSMHKSLLQKIIRYRPKTVTMMDCREYNAVDVCQTSFLMLLIHGGSFVPDIKRHVSGRESAFKRLAVSIAEDSFVEDGSVLTFLFLQAYWCQRFKEYRPTSKIVKRCLKIIRTVIEEPRAFKYDLHNVEEWDLDAELERGFETGSDRRGRRDGGDDGDVVPIDYHLANWMIITKLRSFKWDIDMMQSIYENSGRFSKREIDRSPDADTRNMMVSHALDQHAITDLGYYIHPSVFEHLPAAPNNNYTVLFRAVWQKITGNNSRRDPPIDTSDPVVQAISTGQLLTWGLKSGVVINRKIPVTPSASGASRTRTIKYHLKPETLAGLVGAREFSHNRTVAYVVLRTDDLGECLVIRKPARGKTSVEYTEEEKHLISERFYSVMEEGFTITKAPPALKFLNGKRMVLRRTTGAAESIASSLSETSDDRDLDDETSETREWWIIDPRDGLETKWEEWCHLEYEIPVYDTRDDNGESDEESEKENTDLGFMLNGNYIVPRHKTRLRELVDKYGRAVVERALTYLDTYQSTITLMKISREGTSVEYSVNTLDTFVNFFLSELVCIFPAALCHGHISQKALKRHQSRPTTDAENVDLTNLKESAEALKTEVEGGRGQNTGKWSIKSGPLMWYMVDQIREMVTAQKADSSHADSSSSEESSSSSSADRGYPTPKKEKRKLWEHQLEAIHTLETSPKKGKAIWIPPGLGKTAIVTSYISNQINRGTIQKYIIYTMPASAMATIKRELEMRGLPWVRYKKNNPLEPYHINIILHDELRFAIVHLKDEHVLSETLLVNDEFHKTLNETQRTSAALEMAHMCDEFICMTGTLIKDSNIKDLIKWLEQLVDFEVTLENYWVAIGSLISRKVQTTVVVNREVIEAEMTKSERKRYYQLVPEKLGGTATNIDFLSAVEVSYEAVTRRMVDEIVKCVEDPKIRGAFVVAKNIAHQHEIGERLMERGIKHIAYISKDNSLSLTPSDPKPGPSRTKNSPQVVLTTMFHAEGYNMTRYTNMITSVYFSNLATREQLEKRINRIDQTAKEVTITLVHSGILSYIHHRYENVRSLAEMMKDFASEVAITDRRDED